jgi:hypothetical protein
MEGFMGFLYVYRVDPKGLGELYSNWRYYFALKVDSINVDA